MGTHQILDRVFIRGDLRLTNKRSTLFNDQASGFQITDQLRSGTKLTTLLDGDIAMHLAHDNDRLRFHFAAYVPVFANRQNAFAGRDLALKPAVKCKLIRELDGPFDLNVACQVILGCCICHNGCWFGYTLDVHGLPKRRFLGSSVFHEARLVWLLGDELPEHERNNESGREKVNA